MFTTGQLTFAAIFMVLFAIFIYMSYRKDKALHKKHYKGSRWILLGFLVFVGLLFVIKYWLRE